MAFLEARGLTKRFPGTLALDGVDLDAEQGEVHALVGANGAGKSTLMHVLAGVFPPTSGEIRLEGSVLTFASPSDAQVAGIGVVYQDLSSVLGLTVAENIFLGREPVTRLRLVDRQRLREKAVRLLDTYALDLDPDTPIDRLSIAQRQLVELARALAVSARILILDEPSAVLSGEELTRLFAIIRRLRNESLLIFYVSHRLEEIFAVADRITVLRDGRKVDTANTAEVSQKDLVEMMIGREISPATPPTAERAATGPPLLRMTWGKATRRSSLVIKPGEIVGLAGLVGSGRSEIALRLVGYESDDVQIEIDGRPAMLATPRRALDHGVYYLTEDRKRRGIFSQLSVLANTSAAALRRFSPMGVMAPGRERSDCGIILDKLRVVRRSIDQPTRELSGGNQQKLLIARALLASPRVLLCDEPTQGVDVGAKREIFQILAEIAERGVGVLLISSDFDELLAVCTRLLVVRDGHIVHELAGAEMSVQAILDRATAAPQDGFRHAPRDQAKEMTS